MLSTFFSPWPEYSDEEIRAVERVLRSGQVNYWTGTECREFEKEFAAWAGSRYAVALANGTLALDAALQALGIGEGDEVIVSPRTFIASVSCVVNAGAKPVFADVDLISGNISAETIAPRITPETKAIVCVHLAGWPCDMDPIMALANQHGLKVIEDCAQAHGARYKGRSVGTIGHVGAWSFCQDKIISTGGEGGMITTDNEDSWRAIWSLKDHGKSHSAVYDREHPPGFRWVHDGFGTNWRMIEMQAAIGRLQLRRMAQTIRRRVELANRLIESINEFDTESGPIEIPKFACNTACSKRKNTLGTCASQMGCIHARYKLYINVRADHLRPGWNRDRIINEMESRGMPCSQGSCSEVYLEKAFLNTSFQPVERLPNAKRLGEKSLMFLVHPTITNEQMDAFAAQFREVLMSAAADPSFW